MTWSLLFLVAEWVVRIVMTPIVVRHRRPAAATAWLLIIFFEPIVGLLAYLLFGTNRLPRRRIREHARSAAHVQKLAKFVADNPHVVQPQLEPAQKSLVHLAERLGDKLILDGNQCKLLADTDEVVHKLIADIDKAQHHVHLLFYIFADDETGHRVAGAMAQAVKRGVKCRVLADGVGSWHMFKGLGRQMIQQGIEVHEMLPVNLFRRVLARMDLRNHRKLAVIDGQIAYCGSQNIVNASYGNKKLVWHDVMARLSGPIVLQLQTIFLEDWYFESDEKLDHPTLYPDPDVSGDILFQSLPSGPTYPTESYQRFLVAAIYAAQRQVIITSPYFVPDQALLQALEVAIQRGVRVELVVPKRSDQILVGAAARAYFDQLLESGVIIHRHINGLLHSKTMTVDDSLALVGTGNFDIRSFALNFELNLLAYGPEAAAGLRFLQRNYIQDSEQLSREQWANERGSWARLFDDTAKLFSPLL